MKTNTQPIGLARVPFSGMYAVHSIFHTIQGEGPFCGVPAVFVRLAGCNLQCPLCDTEYTEGAVARTTINVVEQVIAARGKSETQLVVITGGEPFRQQIANLIVELCTAGFFVQIETNGTLDVGPGVAFNLDTRVRRGAYVVVSPKTGKVKESVWRAACAVKYVAQARDLNSDGLPATALGHSATPFLARPPEWFEGVTYLQPADEQDDSANLLNMNACVRSCQRHGYTLQLQIHKLLGVE